MFEIIGLIIKVYMAVGGYYMGRNPNWKEEELTLALELYVSKGLEWLGRIGDTTEEVIALSTLLKGLDLFDEPQNDNFRSVGSVRMKLGNLKMFDPQYSGGSLANTGTMDREIWNKYSGNIQELHSASLKIIRDHYKGKMTPGVKKYIDRINQSATSIRKTDNPANNWEKRMVKVLLDEARSRDDTVLAEKYTEIISLIDKQDIAAQETYHEHAGINRAVIREKKENKIGKHVRDEMRNLIKEDMIWESDLTDFQSEDWSKDVLHLSRAFFVKIDIDKDIKPQLKDSNDYLRYWKDIYYIHGQTYAMCKEWFESGRKHFDKWLVSFIKGKKIICSPDSFKRILLLIKELDEKNVCVSVSDLKPKTAESDEIELIVDYLVRWGVLSSFQGSTREYNIDDYDRFYDMINYPDKYTLRDE